LEYLDEKYIRYDHNNRRRYAVVRALDGRAATIREGTTANAWLYSYRA